VLDLPAAPESPFRKAIHHYEEAKRMPYITSFERHGLRKGLLQSLEACLDVKFGAEGLKLMPEVKEITDIDVLHAVLQAIRTAASPGELRQVWAPECRAPVPTSPQEERPRSVPPLLAEPGRVDEPAAAEGYADVLTRVAAEGRPVIVRRSGADLAAVVPLEHLRLLREVVDRQEVEKLAAEIDWRRAKAPRLPQAWLEDDDYPFEPDEGSAP
jgi:hypothetical protein